MDIKIVDATGQEVSQEATTPGNPATVISEGELLHQQIGTLFDLKPSEVSRFRGKINTLLDYAKSKTEDHSVEGLKWAIRDLSFKIGTPPLGQKLIDHLTRYAMLRTDHAKLEKEIAKIENPSATE